MSDKDQIKDRDKMLTVSDCTLPPPKNWTGKYGRNNQNGVVETRQEWKLKEARDWFDGMKETDKYMASYF